MNGRIANFLKSTHKQGDPARGVPGARDANTIANILNDISGLGCRILKPMDRGGLGWRIVIDGGSDEVYPPTFPVVGFGGSGSGQFAPSIGDTTGGVPVITVQPGFHMTPAGAYEYLGADIPITGTGWLITRQAKSGPGAVTVIFQGTAANPASTTNYETNVCKVTYAAGVITDLGYVNAGERSFIATL